MLTANSKASKNPDFNGPGGSRPKTVFDHTNNADIYWQALIHVANGNKEAALELVAALKNGAPVPVSSFREECDSQNIDTFFDKLFIDSVMRSPQGLSDLALFESIGIKEHNAQLDDVSLAVLEQRLETTKENARLITAFSSQDLSFDQKLSFDIFSWLLNHEVAGEQFLLHEYKINQMYGVPQWLSQVLTQLHTFEAAEDVEHYSMRLSAVSRQFQQALEVLVQQEEKGIILPRSAIEKVLVMIERSIPKDIHHNIFYTHLEQKIEPLNLENKDALLATVRHIIEHEVYPAYQQLHTYFTQLLDRVTETNGVWALPNGDAYYAYMLQHHTTTDLSADEIHTLGLQEVAKIHAQMRQILATEHIDDPEKSVGELAQELAKDPRFYYPNTGEGRAACLADYERILERSRKELGHLFGIKPSSGVTIQRVPVHEEAGSAGAYYCSPSIDGSRPGIFFANLRDMAEVPTYRMETLTIHEAEPGHHFQIGLQSDMNIPILRKLGPYTVFYEGWALYVEKLAYEHDFYSSSFSKIGHLQDELLRAVRLVIDTGIHHKRWSREHAITYMQKMTGYHHNEIASEVDRYLVMPGQACSYKIGQLKILELRQRAKDKLGEKFDIREFHDVILRLAAAPLAVLEKIIDTYIADKISA